MHNKELKIREAKNDNLLNKELKNTIMNSSQSKKKAYRTMVRDLDFLLQRTAEENDKAMALEEAKVKFSSQLEELQAEYDQQLMENAETLEVTKEELHKKVVIMDRRKS